MPTFRGPDELRQAFAETVADILGIEADEVRPERTWDDLQADSLALIEISLILEDAFGIRVPDVEPADMLTVGDALALVERAVAERAPATGSGAGPA